MIKKWLSAYTTSYPRSIVYMLQASEYKILVYIKWYRHIKNFHTVEIRKHFVKTKKSILLLFVAWIINLCIYVFAFSILFSTFWGIKYFLSFAVILAAPYVLAYGIVIPLLVIKLAVQSPIRYFIIKSAQK